MTDEGMSTLKSIQTSLDDIKTILERIADGLDNQPVEVGKDEKLSAAYRALATVGPYYSRIEQEMKRQGIKISRTTMSQPKTQDWSNFRGYVEKLKDAGKVGILHQGYRSTDGTVEAYD